MKISRLLGATALAGSLLLTPSVAFAQDEPADTAAAPQDDATAVPQDDEAVADEAQDGTIVVTGSRIRRPNLESTVPITSIAGESFFQQGQTSIGDSLNDLPQLRSTFAQQNPGLGIGIAGLNLLDLRGLGTQRTLTLVNGRRHVPADILNNAVSVDINTIPSDLIERVDIVTGGNSAIYGSDAIAGVVNFVLRRDYEGVQIRGTAAVNQEGYGGNQYVSAMWGMNFGDGKGNITLHGEYAHQERIFASDIDAFRTQDGFVVVDADAGAGLVNGSDGIPDRIFIRDIRGTTIHFNGLIPVVQPTGAGALCGTGTAANNGPPNNSGTPYNCTYIFTNEGRLIPQTGTRYGSGPTGGIYGGNGQSGREGMTMSILPYMERYNFNLLTHYEFSPALEFFAEAKWNRVNALGNNAGPSFIQGQITQFDFRERPRLDNPFLNPADRTTLANAILASGFEPRLVSRTALTPATTAQVNDGSLRFDLARNLLDIGLRDENFTRDTWRVVGGFRGTFNEDWGYEFSVNYGKFREDIVTEGFIDRQRFMLAMDAGRNPVTGQIQCRSQFDPASAVPLQRAADPASTQAANAARLAADIAACKPYNPFGSTDNSAAIAYLARTFYNSSGLGQLVLSGFVSGDASQLFELPGGPIRFALGAEYRRETAFYTQDTFTTDGFTNGVSIPSFVAEPFTVKEAFGEIQIPLLANIPFFEELTFSGAGRVAKYQGDVGTVYSYNAGADWAPIQDIRFRGNYSRAVRAPNISETGFPLVPNFSPGFIDPCNPGSRGSGVRNTNCTADLGGLLGNLTDITQSLGIVSGSNPNLVAETSNSLTLGAVVQPRFIPGMSLSVDYYDIKVKNIITSLTPQTIVNNCYDSASLNNVFCAQFTRWRGPGNGPNGEVPGRILSNSLINAPVNFAARVRRGIDVNFSYRTDIPSVGKFNTSLIYTHNLKISNYQDPLNPAFENRVLSELGDPKDEFRWDVDLETGPITFGYRMRFIGKQLLTVYEDIYELNGLPPANEDFADTRWYPNVFYHDLRLAWDITRDDSGDSLNWYVGVDNIANKMPPLGSTATGVGSAIYSIRGRNFYTGFRARF